MLVANLDPREVERVEHQLDLPAHQRRIDLVAVAVQRYRRGLRDRPLGRPQERLPEQRRGRQRRRAGGVEPLKRCLPGLGVHASVVDDLQPSGEQSVQLRELDPVVDLNQESIAHGPEKALNFAFRGGRPRACVNQLHAKHGTRAQQLRGHERRPPVDQDRRRNTTRHQTPAERGLQPEHVLTGAPPPPDQQPGVIIDERQQHRPPRCVAGQLGAVQSIPRPQLVAHTGFEAAIDLPRRAAISPDVQPGARQVRLQRP